MNVTINGLERTLDERATVEEALVAAGHEGRRYGVAVAVNGELVPRKEWKEKMLSPGDRVEVLVAAQGG